uniref:Uncharacterized protein n=1 Tax=Candidatus Methanophagaceae archaeon ANME-1 ERB6 TaxID=2759912 RepID=A0A7G9Z0J4_9EURY|nr:hypothetical protein JMICBFOL_00027 [Methanosarcinales archaeon ANME-1 ERB6]
MRGVELWKGETYDDTIKHLHILSPNKRRIFQINVKKM